MHELSLLRRMVELLEQGRSFVRAQVISIKGSSPRETDAGMLIHPDGTIEGTVGGGRFEAMVTVDAVQLLEGEGRTDLKEYKLTRESLGMYCAGQVQVLLEAHRPQQQLIVFGGGHVGQALARMASVMGSFGVAVVDDREEFATAERHPTASRVVHTDAAYERDIPEIGPDTFAVIVTRCHDVDKVLVKRLAGTPCAYLGMIGSESKVRLMWSELEREGVPREQLERIHAPIGLDLGGKAPGEIAVSILAQILKVRDRQADTEAQSEQPQEVAG